MSDVVWSSRDQRVIAEASAGTRTWSGPTSTTVRFSRETSDKCQVRSALQLLLHYFRNALLHVFTAWSFLVGLTCWEMENFLPNQLEDGKHSSDRDT